MNEIRLRKEGKDDRAIVSGLRLHHRGGGL